MNTSQKIPENNDPSITGRRQEALRESEQRFRGLFENSGDAIQILDNNIFVECNQATVEILRAKNKDEVLSTHPSQLSPEFQPDGRPSGEKANEMIQTALKQGSHRFEWMHRRMDGEDFPVEVLLTPVVVGDKTIIYSSWRDIAERKLVEARLNESEARYHLLSEATIEGVVIHDKGLLLDANETFATLFGYDQAEVIGMAAVDFLTPETREITAQNIRSGYEKPYEVMGLRKDGATFPVEITGKAIPYQGRMVRVTALRDITERKQLEVQVQESFERRGYQVRVSTEISQEVAAASEISDLFDRVVTLTKERLGYYHTQLLRYDATQDAVVLVNGYGETGQKMLAGGHKLPMGTGLIGTAAASGQTVMRPTLAQDPDWQPNPLLPETKGEIAVPIKWQDTVLGVLDVQSNQAGALTEDDRLLLEGLCGQVAVAIEGTRLRQEMAERLEEVNRLYRAMSHEGWKDYRDTADLPAGFMFDQAGTRPVDEAVLADELFANIPMRVLGGEVVGTLTVANDPQHPTSPEEYTFLQQVSDQIALALESARLFDQTQSALAQTEKLFEASGHLSQAADLQELVGTVVSTLNIPEINRAILVTFNYSPSGDLDGLDVIANWWNGSGHETTAIGTHYSLEVVRLMSLFLSPTPVFFNDAFSDERVDSTTLELVKRLNLRAVAALPLHAGTHQIGALLLEAEEAHNFTQDESRLYSALAPQIATVLENRRQFERAQQQAERESTLNVISQKIQSATTVEAVLQIAARELGHALGAPMTIAQLSMKAKQ